MHPQTYIRILGILLRTERLLSQRVKWGEWFYAVFVLLICLLVGVLAGVPLLMPGFVFESEQDRKTMFAFIPFLVLSFDLIATTLRFQNHSMIEPRHLTPYAIDDQQGRLFRLTLLVLDFRSGPYWVASMLFAIFFVFHSTLMGVLVCTVCWILFLLATSVWYSFILQIAAPMLMKHRQHVVGIFFGLLFLVNGLNIFKMQYLYSEFPLTGFVGNGLYAILQNDRDAVIVNMVLLIIIILTGMFLLLATKRTI